VIFVWKIVWLVSCDARPCGCPMGRLPKLKNKSLFFACFLDFLKTTSVSVHKNQQWYQPHITAGMPLLVQNLVVKGDFEPAVISKTEVVRFRFFWAVLTGAWRHGPWERERAQIWANKQQTKQPMCSSSIYSYNQLILSTLDIVGLAQPGRRSEQARLLWSLNQPCPNHILDWGLGPGQTCSCLTENWKTHKRKRKA